MDHKHSKILLTLDLHLLILSGDALARIDYKRAALKVRNVNPDTGICKLHDVNGKAVKIRGCIPSN
jgi:hypothetical protein